MSFSMRAPDVRGMICCGHCPHHTVLPWSRPAPIPEPQELWPNGKDWLYFACPACRRVAGHRDYEQTVAVLPHQTTPNDGKIVIRISYRCAGTTCGVPVQFYVLEDATSTNTEREWRDLLASGYWIGLVQCGHPPAIREGQAVWFDVIQAETLQGYDRERLEEQMP